MKDLIYVMLKEAPSAPGKFLLFPAGEVEFNGYGNAVMDEPGANLIIEDFKRRGLDMVIDYEHQSLKDAQAPAAGWIKDIFWENGLWVVTDWTKKAADYLTAKEYRYFSPVILIDKISKRIVALVNVALTNTPRTNNQEPLVAKDNKSPLTVDLNPKEEEKIIMLKKLKTLLGLADTASDDELEAAVKMLVNKNKIETVACKDVLDALGAKEGADKPEVIRIVASLKAPGDVAVQLSHRVAELEKELSGIKQADLVTIALKEGKTSPEELEKWGKELALKSPDQFKLIVLSRPAGSVIPVTDVVVAKDKQDAAADDATMSIAAMMGNSGEDIKKYGTR